jgi:hypothetical protein
MMSMKVIQERKNMKIVQLDDGRVIELYRLRCPKCNKIAWQEYFEECGLWGKKCSSCGFIYAYGGSYECEEIEEISKIEERLDRIKRITNHDVVRDVVEVEKRLDKIKDLLNSIKS